MYHKPLITVMIIAYKRKEFILDAIKSVLQQTINKQDFEIIVVKNFVDEDIDSYISSYQIKSIMSEEITLLGKILEGTSISLGYFISILEDDDKFKIDKLCEIKEAYECNPDLVYIHNNYDLINQDGKIITKKSNNFGSEYIIRSDILKPKKVNFCINHGYHNNSCITIRRSILISNMTFLRDLKSNNWVDLSLLFVSLSYIQLHSENYHLLITNKILTEYRVHKSLSSFIPQDSKQFVSSGMEIGLKELKLIEGFSNRDDGPLSYYTRSFLQIESVLFSILDPLNHNLSKVNRLKLVLHILFTKYKVMSKRSIRIIIISMMSLLVGERLIRAILISLLKNGKSI